MEAPASAATRRVSVLVPCRNERDHIERLLDEALAQEAPGVQVEVLVADGASDDGTRGILDARAAREPRLRVVDNPQRIVSTGLNRALGEARGDVVLRMDAHTSYPADYMATCLEVLEATGAANVGGPARTRASGRIQRAVAAAYHSPFSVGGARFHDVSYEGPVDTVPYGCWPRSTFERVGVFDEELVRNQDDEHNLRVRRAGLVVWQSPRIVSHYEVRSSLGALFRQYAQYGYWKVLVIRKHRLPASFRHLVPATFVAAVLGLGVAALFVPAARWMLLGLLGTYALLVGVASAFAARRAGAGLFPLLLATFPCFHLGYGIGFLRGIADFLVLKRAPTPAFERLTREAEDPGDA